jgi:hypothetical protein
MTPATAVGHETVCSIKTLDVATSCTFTSQDRINEFLTSKLPVSHESKPLVLQEVVRVARKSLEENQGWQGSPAYWGSGRATTLYSNL